MSWLFVEWWVTGKPSVLGAISGAVAGLVAITPASGFVQPMAAILIGAAAGAVCYLMVSRVKRKFGYDDSLDAFGVHGIGGTLGAVLTGVFATRAVNDLRSGKAMGWVDGDGGQVVNQAIAVAISWVLAIVGTLVILKICDAVLGVRVDANQETEGLDLSMHGEDGYNFEG
jgi:Amt family ammonium transporter